MLNDVVVLAASMRSDDDTSAANFHRQANEIFVFLFVYTYNTGIIKHFILTKHLSCRHIPHAAAADANRLLKSHAEAREKEQERFWSLECEINVCQWSSKTRMNAAKKWLNFFTSIGTGTGTVILYEQDKMNYTLALSGKYRKIELYISQLFSFSLSPWICFAFT